MSHRKNSQVALGGTHQDECYIKTGINWRLHTIREMWIHGIKRKSRLVANKMTVAWKGSHPSVHTNRLKISNQQFDILLTKHVNDSLL